MSLDTENTEASPTLAITPDTFASVLSLIALVNKSKVCAVRVRELRAVTAAAKTAQAELATARAEHDAFVAKERRELEEAKNEIANREAKVLSRESLVAIREKFAGPRTIPGQITVQEGSIARTYHPAIDGAERVIKGDDSRSTVDQNKLPMPSRHRRRDARHLPPRTDNTFPASTTLTREPS